MQTFRQFVIETADDMSILWYVHPQKGLRIKTANYHFSENHGEWMRDEGIKYDDQHLFPRGRFKISRKSNTADEYLHTGHSTPPEVLKKISRMYDLKGMKRVVHRESDTTDSRGFRTWLHPKNEGIFVESKYYHDSLSPQWGYITPSGKILDGTKEDVGYQAAHGDLSKKLRLGDIEDACARGYIRFAVLRDGSALFSFTVPDRGKSSLKQEVNHTMEQRLKLVKRYLESSEFVHRTVTLDIDYDGFESNIVAAAWDGPKQAIRAINTALADKSLQGLSGKTAAHSLEARFMDA